MSSVSVFNAGPAKIPDEVLKQIQDEMLNFDNSGMSILELSHRSPEFVRMLGETTDLLRSCLQVPENYQILWLQGGASGMFSAVPLNLVTGAQDVVDYIVTGNWSNNAAKEAEKYAKVNYVAPRTSSFTGVPTTREMNFTEGAKYVYYCENETVYGIEFPDIVSCDTTIVCDMSSNLLSRPVDVSRFGMIFASVQKNIAPAGLAVAIIRDDLINSEHYHPVPKIWDFKLQSAGKSCVNTPNVFSIYVTNLVLKNLISNGGLKHFSEMSDRKSNMLYDIVDRSCGFYISRIEKDSRSRMNVTFNLKTVELESEFVKRTNDMGLIGLKGHRSIGGIRASLYNAVTLDDTKKLAEFMLKFQKEHEKA